MRPGQPHSFETRARLKAAMADPARRAKISTATKERMADPAVRQRIKDGMARASGEAAEIAALRAAWGSARPAVRLKFIADTFEAACSASAVKVLPQT